MFVNIYIIYNILQYLNNQTFEILQKDQVLGEKIPIIFNLIICNLEEAIKVAETVKRVIEGNKCHSVIWCGDFYTDFRRNTRQVKLTTDVTAAEGMG